MRIGVLFGGRSVEHEISVISAGAVASALEAKSHQCLYLCIDREGVWHLMDSVSSADSAPSIARLSLSPGIKPVIRLIEGTDEELKHKINLDLDLIFPVLHGAFGEDGKIQGLLDACCVKYVGAGIVPSVLTNDKEITKRLLSQAGIKIAKYVSLYREDYQNKLHKASLPAEYKYTELTKKLGTPFWVKPANLGSSLGISQVTKESELAAALDKAFKLDHKLMIEEHIAAREMELSVLEKDGQIIVSEPGEIVLKGHSFYDYDAKYIEDDGAELIIPTKLRDPLLKEAKEIALRVFQTLDNKQIMRLDFFVRDDKDVIVNEVQTIPGFTSISMYPKLLEAGGIAMEDLVDGLVQEAYKS